MSQVLPSIFVSVASFCDPLLNHTIRDGVNKADHPARICWAVVDQHPHDRGSELRPVLGASSLRYMQIHPVQSRGVCWARSLAGTLFQGEDYLLQIDSHTLFEPGWDSELIKQITELRLRSAKPVISIYPYGFEFVEGQAVPAPVSAPGMLLVFRTAPGTTIADDHLTLTMQAIGQPATEAVEGFHLAGGFIFAPGAFVQELPYDPRLYFHGEEQSLALRAYTHGWDIYHPVHIPLYHHYKPANSSHATQHWQPQWEQERDFKFSELTHAAHERLRDLIDSRRDLGVYGLGSKRTLKSFAAASGIDYANRRLGPPTGPSPENADRNTTVHVVELNPFHPRPYVFTDYARSLVETLRASGQSARHVVNALPFEGHLFVLGWTPQWLQDNRAQLDPERTILFNGEALSLDESHVHSDRVKAMRGWMVADMHGANVKILKAKWGDEVRVVEIPVVPHAVLGQRVAELDVPLVDVVFFGSTSPRRRVALETLESAGLSVRHHEGAYGEELMPWLQRARLLVHVHHDRSHRFPALRMLRPVMMGLPVVCETSEFSSGNDWSASGMVFCDIEHMVSTCKGLLNDPGRQRSIARACREHALSMSLRGGSPGLFDLVKASPVAG